MACDWNQVTFGETGLKVSALGLGSSYGLSGTDVERAFDRGVNFMFWGARRRDSFGEGIARVAARRRDDVVIAIQTYARVAATMETSVDCALRTLGVDHVDLLCLAWWDHVPAESIVDVARNLKQKGKARHLMVSCHDRPTFDRHLDVAGIEAMMVRYNAGHPGAERDVFPLLGERKPGVLAFTATRWGSLLDPALTPKGERTPSATDCYRFALTNPHVHATLAGPRNGVELDQAMAALDRGPMTADEVAWMKRVGAHVRDAKVGNPIITTLDRVRSAIFPTTHSPPA